jgi:ABC-type multidrug transport system fused ATPase/permease subunit
MSGRTTFTIAHRLSTLRNTDLILVIDQGRVAGLGSHEALMRNCPLYGRLWEAQQAPYPTIPEPAL